MGSRITKEVLNDLYWNKGLTQVEISKALKVGRDKVMELMKQQTIPTRDTRFKRTIRISKEELNYLYWDCRMSLGEIAKSKKVNLVSILELMRNYGIARRKLSEAQYQRWVKDIDKRYGSLESFKKTLRNLYVKEGLSSRQVGEKLGITNFCVLENLDRFKIPKRTSAETRNLQRQHGDSSEHDRKIHETIKTYEKSGFHCVPIHLSIAKVQPDFIAIKDNKVFAVEVENDLPIPADKYNGIVYFDDIHWVIIKERR